MEQLDGTGGGELEASGMTTTKRLRITKSLLKRFHSTRTRSKPENVERSRQRKRRRGNRRYGRSGNRSVFDEGHVCRGHDPAVDQRQNTLIHLMVRREESAKFGEVCMSTRC